MTKPKLTYFDFRAIQRDPRADRPAHVEDLRHKLIPTMTIADEDKKRAARQELATGYLPAWAAFTENQLGEGPFVGGAKIQVVDLKLYIAHKWVASGSIDHVPATLFEGFPKLTRVAQAVAAHERVKSWVSGSRSTSNSK